MKMFDLVDALGLLGFAALVIGLALVSIPLALVTTGALLLGAAIWRDLASTRRRP